MKKFPTTLILFTLLRKIKILVQCHDNPRVIIIGAGASGVAAATRLLENNFTNIVILEAEDRIGGRIHSVKFRDAFIDMGAHWCHGDTDNVVYSLVKNLNVLQSSRKRARIYFSSRSTVSEEFNEELIDAISSSFAFDTKGVRDSVENYYTTKYVSILESKFQNNTTKLNLALRTTRLLKQILTSLRGAFTLNDTIVDRDYKTCPGDLHLHWNGAGYKTILDVMIGRFPNSSKSLPFEEILSLGKEVSSISWNSSFNKIVTSDGDTFEGDYVIFTPSIGVLKSEQGMFVPALPNYKRDAIRAIGFAAKMDVSFYFPEKWWEGEMDDYYFVWGEDDITEELPNINKFGSWVLNLFYVISNPKNPNVLTVWIIGPDIPKIELLPDEEITAGVLYVFNRFFGHLHNVTKPCALIRSNWHNNPHFRGIHSYQTQKAFNMQPSAEVQLSQPLENQSGHPVLFFAGEATHPYYYSTVHGAIETGYREANRILKLRT